MAIYYVNGEKINIPTHNKPFGLGSEGCLYLIDNKLYKIYHPNSLNEGFGNKKFYHQSLLTVKDQFKKFILPEDLIFDAFGNYVGYTTPLVGGKNKKREGITSGSWDNLVTNLKDFEKEIKLLSENRFLAVDIGFHNSVFSKEDSSLYMIDPGRYHHESLFTIPDYHKRNKLMLENYFFHMLEREMIYFKLIPIKKVPLLAKNMQEEKLSKSYSEYFEEISQKEDSIHEFIKKKGRFLK